MSEWMDGTRVKKILTIKVKKELTKVDIRIFFIVAIIEYFSSVVALRTVISRL